MSPVGSSGLVFIPLPPSFQLPVLSNCPETAEAPTPFLSPTLEHRTSFLVILVLISLRSEDQAPPGLMAPLV